MVLKDELAEEGLPVAGNGVHPVDGHAGADGGEGIPGEVEIGQGVHGEGVVILRGGDIVPQPGLACPQLALADAGHHGGYHLLVWQSVKVRLQALTGPGVGNVGLRQILPDQLLTDLRAGEGFCHQIRQVHHFHALAPQAVGKSVVFPLGLLQVGDVVKEQALQIFGHQVFQFLARAVEQNFFQPPDFRGIVDSSLQMRSLLCVAVVWILH